MELSELLDTDRVRCRCSIQSKKRTLQTLAELLSGALRHTHEADVTAEAEAGETASNGAATERKGIRRLDRKAKAREEAARSADDPPSDMTILDAFISRERLGSTALGHGVALPHSRLPGIERPLAALLTLSDGVDFESTDEQSVDLVLGLLVPEDCNDEHLQILATLARRFNDDALRERLRGFDDADELMSHLKSLD